MYYVDWPTADDLASAGAVRQCVFSLFFLTVFSTQLFDRPTTVFAIVHRRCLCLTILVALSPLTIILFAERWAISRRLDRHRRPAWIQVTEPPSHRYFYIFWAVFEDLKIGCFFTVILANYTTIIVLFHRVYLSCLEVIPIDPWAVIRFFSTQIYHPALQQFIAPYHRLVSYYFRVKFAIDCCPFSLDRCHPFGLE